MMTFYPSVSEMAGSISYRRAEIDKSRQILTELFDEKKKWWERTVHAWPAAYMCFMYMYLMYTMYLTLCTSIPCLLMQARILA